MAKQFFKIRLEFLDGTKKGIEYKIPRKALDDELMGRLKDFFYYIDLKFKVKAINMEQQNA